MNTYAMPIPGLSAFWLTNFDYTFSQYVILIYSPVIYNKPITSSDANGKNINNSRQMAHSHDNDDDIGSKGPKSRNISQLFAIFETAVKTGAASGGAGIMTYQILYPWMISLSYAFPVAVVAIHCCYFCFCHESTLTTAT